MAFQKGDPNIASGTKAHRYYSFSPRERYKALLNVMDEFNYDPVVELIHLSQCAKSEKVRCDATMHLADKVMPSLKAITHDGEAAGSRYTLNITYHGKDKEDKENIIEGESIKAIESKPSTMDDYARAAKIMRDCQPK